MSVRPTIDLCLNLTGQRAGDVVAAAAAAEAAGFDSVSLSDELTDVSGGGSWSHEPWTLLSAVAAVTHRIALGTMVLNVANRDAGTTAVAAATLQDLSGGRLWLGLGAGTDRSSLFARDQLALGRVPPRAPQRRENLQEYLRAVRAVWDDTSSGFLRPDPLPALVVGAFGPLTAALAGREADGIACPLDGFGEHPRPAEDLLAGARESFAASGRHGRLGFTAHTGPDETWDDEQFRDVAHRGPLHERLLALCAERFTVFCSPAPEEVTAAAAHLGVGAALA